MIPEFPVPDATTMLTEMFKIPVSGRIIAPRSALQCRVCRRRIGPMGRLLCPLMPTCDHVNCQMAKVGNITGLFKSPYGRAITRAILATFSRVVELPNGSVLVQRQPIIDRAEVLVNGYVELIKWQKVFDLWERHTNAGTYALGKVTLVPPRRIDETLAIRATDEAVPIDPTRHLPEELQLQLRQVYKEGKAALEIPF